MNNKNTTRAGFTLIELMVTVLLASIVFLGVAVVLADSVRGYKQMLTRIHGNIVNDAYFARVKFDSICRRSSRFAADIIYDAANPAVITLFLYSDNITPTPGPDRFANFYLSGLNNGDLTLDQGPATYDDATKLWTTGAVDSSMVVAKNVTGLNFSVIGKSVQMTLTVDDGKHGLTVTSSAVKHN